MRVTVGPGTSNDFTPIVQSMTPPTPPSVTWFANVGNIPPGAGRTFLVEASNASNVVVYRGETTATIVANQTAQVYLMIQEVLPPNQFGNHAPLIDSLTASASAVEPSATVALEVIAHDVDSSSLTYAWSATCGSFQAGGDSPNATWQSPAVTEPTTCTVSIKVSDVCSVALGPTCSSSVTASLQIRVVPVIPPVQDAGADIYVFANSCPVVTSIVANETFHYGADGGVDGYEADLTVIAIEPDNDPLSYAWTSDCGAVTAGNPSSSAHFSFVDPAALTRDCVVTLGVSDTPAPLTGFPGPLPSCTNTTNTTLSHAVDWVIPTDGGAGGGAPDDGGMGGGAGGGAPDDGGVGGGAGGGIGGGSGGGAGGGTGGGTAIFGPTANTAFTRDLLDVRNVATDLSGNVYIAGFLANTAATSIGGVAIPTSKGIDMVVAKLDPNTYTGTATGNWVRQISDPGTATDSQYAHGVALTSNGTIGVYGSYLGTVTIGASLPAASASMEFVAALDQTGTGLWSHGYNFGDGVLLAIAGSLEQNALVVCGPSTIATTSLVPGATHCSALTGTDPASCGTPATCDGTTTSGLCDPAHTDIVVAKFDPTNGNVLWSRQIGGTGNQLCSALAIDQAGNVIMAGTYNGTLDLAPGGTPTPWSITSGRSQMYVARLDGASGQTTIAVPFLNGTAGGGLGAQAISGVSIDGNGDILIAGAMNRTVAFSSSVVLRANGNSGSDVFAVKLSGADLNPLWGRRWGDNSADVARGVSVDSMGQVYVVGEFSGNADVGMGAGDSCSLAPCTPAPTPITSASPNAVDAFVVRLDGTTGATTFARPYGDANGQSALAVTVSRLATTTERDAVQVMGTFTGQIDFGLGAPLASEGLGFYDIFLAKFE